MRYLTATALRLDKFLLICALLLFSTSCTNAPTYNNNYYPGDPSAQQLNYRLLPQECSLYWRPKERQIPPVPIEEIQSLSPGDIDTKLNIMVAYAEKLRNFIKMEREAEIQAYNDYINRCRQEKEIKDQTQGNGIRR